MLLSEQAAGGTGGQVDLVLERSCLRVDLDK